MRESAAREGGGCNMGTKQCSHGKLKISCADCKGCPHGKLKRNCADCNPCPHGKLKRKCVSCRGE